MTVEIVAEIGASHAQDITIAKRLIKAAADAGANCVKFQTWDEMTVCQDVIQSGPWAGKTLIDLYAEAKLPWGWHAELFAYARDLGIEPFSTPFDKKSVDFLETLGCTRYKIASFEITNLELIAYVASTGKPLILSTGMATEGEIKKASAALQRRSTLLRCVSAYPAEPSDYNLLNMARVPCCFGHNVGVSDHTKGSAVACVAIALGAVMVEKHIQTFDANLDAGFATNTAEFSRFVKDCRDAEASIGKVEYGACAAEWNQLQFRRSIWVIRDMQEGEAFCDDNVRVLRPVGGLPPGCIGEVRLARASRPLKRGWPLRPEDVKTS